jgi:RimJ/RimL family protein N-acetyltransferase
LRIIADDSDRVAAWVSDRTGSAFFGPHLGIGLERDERLIAGVVVHDWNGANFELTLAGKAVFGRVFQRYLRAYARQLGAKRVTFRMSAERGQLHRTAERMGFKREGFQPAFYPDGSASVLYGLRLDNGRT